jgi:hypothetical protein
MFIKKNQKSHKLSYLLVFVLLLSASIIIYLFINQRLKVSQVNIITLATSNTTANCIPYTVPDPRPFFERDFPQSNLPRRISNISDEDIFRQLRSLRLLLLSTGRDVEGNIESFRKRTEAIVDLFHPSSRILICESDSSDKTVDKLYSWPRAQVYQYGKMSKKYPDRPQRIAFCRNKLLNISHELTADYLLMVDLDMFSSSISSLISNFRYNPDDWSVMTTSSSTYYDIWALRTLSDSVMNYDVWDRATKILRNEKQYCPDTVVPQIIGVHQKPIPAEHGLIEVRSAFNGAGLYRANLTHGCQYSGAGGTCEHVPFHLCMREKNGARIFINPAFLLG